MVRTCGKMYWLDQILVKLYATGHRVLLFSTMTRMLDTVEFYLNWRKVDKNDGSGEKVLMKSRRIDGATTLDNREAAIKEFNSPDSGEVWLGSRAQHFRLWGCSGTLCLTCHALAAWHTLAG